MVCSRSRNDEQFGLCTLAEQLSHPAGLLLLGRDDGYLQAGGSEKVILGGLASCRHGQELIEQIVVVTKPPSHLTPGATGALLV